jgi:hypothetical protein
MGLSLQNGTLTGAELVETAVAPEPVLERQRLSNEAITRLQVCRNCEMAHVRVATLLQLQLRLAIR